MRWCKQICWDGEWIELTQISPRSLIPKSLSDLEISCRVNLDVSWDLSRD